MNRRRPSTPSQRTAFIKSYASCGAHGLVSAPSGVKGLFYNLDEALPLDAFRKLSNTSQYGAPAVAAAYLAERFVTFADGVKGIVEDAVQMIGRAPSIFVAISCSDGIEFSPPMAHAVAHALQKRGWACTVVNMNKPKS